MQDKLKTGVLAPVVADLDAAPMTLNPFEPLFWARARDRSGAQIVSLKRIFVLLERGGVAPHPDHRFHMYDFGSNSHYALRHLVREEPDPPIPRESRLLEGRVPPRPIVRNAIMRIALYLERTFTETECS